MIDEFDQGRYAYVTLLSTSNYLDAVLVLNKSLRRVHSKYPLLVALTENVNNPEIISKLEQHHILWEVVQPLQYHSSVTEKYHEIAANVLNTASKLQIFTLKDWDRLVYIDADVLVLQNIDDLFNKPDGAMLKYPDDNMGFTGLFVFCPRYHQEDEFYPTLIAHHDCVDGDLIGKLWFFVRESPAHQIDLTYLWHYSPYITAEEMKNIKAVHFCNNTKPWLCFDESYFPKGLYVNWLYQEILKEVHNSHN